MFINCRKSTMKLGNKNDTVEVEVILGRRLIGTFMTIYMPTILLNIIGHSTNYFKPFFFEAVVTVNLTVQFRIKMTLVPSFIFLWIRSCWSWQPCLLEWARVCQRQAASRWWTIGSCLISSFLLWRFWSTLTRWDIVFIDPIRTASLFSSDLKDTLRGDETEVNHHGRSVTVGGKENSITPVEAGMKKPVESPPSYNNLVSVREDVQVKMANEIGIVGRPWNTDWHWKCIWNFEIALWAAFHWPCVLR